MEVVKSMMHTPSTLLSCALKIVEVLGSFRFVAQRLSLQLRLSVICLVMKEKSSH
jgi:hypothetical protein